MQDSDQDSTFTLGGRCPLEKLLQLVDFMKLMKKTPYSGCLLVIVSAIGVLSPMAARALDYHVNSPQTLQNALTLAAASSVSNNIYVTNGYYTGNFNYNSTTGNYLTLMAEPGVSNNQITIDGGGTGASMNISGTVTSNITVQGMTFLRNCGNTSLAGLQIAGATNCLILVNGCLLLSPSNSSGMGLILSSGLNATVTNCTLAGCPCGIWSGFSGRGITISGVTGNVAVQNCTVTTNNSVSGGYGANDAGGLYVSGAGVVLVTGSVFSGNSEGGANGFGGAINCSATTITLSGNLFTGNSSTAYAGWTDTGEGGGVFCSGTTITLSGNTFDDNVAAGSNGSGYGGGVFCSGTTITLSGNTFTENLSTSDGGGEEGSGGGAYCSGTTITLSGNTFTGNMAGSGSGSGGGADCSGAIVMLSDNTFTSNSATTTGGGASCSGTVTLTNNTFNGNSTTGGDGGGANCSGPMSVSGNTFQQNTALSGGGLYASGPTINLQDNLVVKNALTTNLSQGGGIWVDASATLNMINNTVTGNTSPGSGGGVAYVMTAGVELLNIYNNIIWGNSAPDSGGDVWVSGTGQQTVFDNNDVDSIYGVFSIAQNDIDLSPQFFNPISGDYHTQSTSPCKAVGNISAPSLPSTDLDGTPRVLNGLVDLGCYEFTTNVVHPADTNALFVITPSEFNAYAAAWKNGQTWTNGPTPGPNPVPANYMTRAGYLMTNGGSYYNDGSARPVNWKTNQ
jgi:hypothetical protein